MINIFNSCIKMVYIVRNFYYIESILLVNILLMIFFICEEIILCLKIKILFFKDFYSYERKSSDGITCINKNFQN